MSDKDFDPFAPSTGLPDDFDAVVKAAWFEYDPEFNNGQSLVLKMTLQTDAEDFGPDGDGTGDLLLSTGKGWTTNDRGVSAVREDGKSNKGFHQSTAYHMWIDGAIKCDGAEKVLRSGDRGDPRVAAMWVGTAWHINAKPIDYGVIDGQNVGVRNKLVPSKFLGLADDLRTLQGGQGGGGQAQAQAQKPAAVAKKAPGVVKKAAPAKPATTATGVDAELRAQLKALALAAETHEQFVEQAFELAAVSEDDAAQQAVMDGGEGSIWAEAVAEYQASQA